MGYMFLPDFGCRTKSASSILSRRKLEMARKLREREQEQQEESDEDEEENGEAEEFRFDKALALRWQMLERRAEKMRSNNSEMNSEAEELMRNNLNRPSFPGVTIPVY
ncbi:hypothetical protein MKW98_013884 [Papaver atlanticum]|uniref:Uncharacterized protein n=1 Tax=Papaver atlanticum TaxID=357466 RepID=A0AAD4SG11_9MAGN|nr:hypothetical protein MKW98_013884 [Papaver atlanticum]